MHTKGIIMPFDAKKVLNICQRCVSTAKFGSRKASTEQRRRCRRTQLRCQTLGVCSTVRPYVAKFGYRYRDRSGYCTSLQ